MPKRESGFFVGYLFDNRKAASSFSALIEGWTGCPDCTISTC
jgi:hypothetical protein